MPRALAMARLKMQSNLPLKAEIANAVTMAFKTE